MTTTTPQLNAALVELNISVWTARKLDKGVTRELNNDKAASDQAARVNKNLMAGLDNLKKITDFTAMVRNELIKLTLPWSDAGARLVPMMQFMDVKTWLNAQDIQFEALVSQFLADYPNLISAQAFQLGTMFNRNEYPTVDEIKDKFRFRVGFLPVPTSGDFRVDALAGVQDELKAQYEGIYNERIQQVNQDMWQRLHKVMTAMSERLTLNEDGTRKVFRDSLVNNATELCDMLTRLNVTNDPDLEKARQYLESTLLGVDIDELKCEGAREEVKEKIDTALEAWF